MTSHLTLRIDDLSYDVRPITRGTTSDGVIVERLDGRDRYTVNLDGRGKATCTCKDFTCNRQRITACKHGQALLELGYLEVPAPAAIAAPTRRSVASKVHGVTYTNGDGTIRQWVIQNCLAPGVRLSAIPEPDNPHDANAIGLWVAMNVRNFQVGYLSREIAQEYSRWIDPIIAVRAITGGGKLSLGVNISIEFTDATI
jgi:hypothetical protein